MLVGNSRKPTNFEEKINNGIKIHTIRLDKHDRWKTGIKIHFATGARSGNYNCFKEGACIDTQKIKIKGRRVFIDHVDCTWEEVEVLAKNDGFDSLDDFWAWFDKYSPFNGKIIHWTKFLY